MATISSTLTLVDNMTSKLNTIRDAVDEVQSSLNSIGGTQDQIDKFSWDTFLSNAEAAGKKMEEIGKKMTLAITGPLLLLGKKMYGNAVDYESAFTGVKKTTDATEEEYAALYSGLLEMSENTPTGFVEGAAIMEMAGQLGVAKEELLGFTQAYIGLQESTNIQGEGGAADLARFLNVTEKTTANVDRVGGVIVGLGNNFATTENEILAMATRMGATADLAGFSAPEILAFSAALSSVGINAEAGGSAAGKLMKKMQLAAEVGGTAQERLAAAGYEYANGLDFSNAVSAMGKQDLVALADDLGMTTDAVNDLASSWLALDQFSSVMGLDQAGFLKSWDEGAAQSMLLFFQGLGNLDPESGNSVLAQLAEMDITEIRLSNLVAAMAGNSALFQAALEEAYRQYSADPATNAMAEEVAKRYATQESQNEMLGNKLDNTMADFGQNLVDALQPALEVVNGILDAFNSLSESDQTALIETLGAIALLGPTLTVVGTAVEMISKIGQLAGKATKIGSVFSKIGTFITTTPVGQAIAIATAIGLIAAAISAIPTESERILNAVKDIQITVDQDSVDETLAAIRQVREEAEKLKNPEVSVEYENTSAAVSMGYGTETMYGKALGYEAAKANAEIDGMIADYSGRLREIESNIANATTESEKAEWFGKYEQVEAEMNTAVAERQRLYSEKVSELFNGMAAQYPEAAAALEQAGKQYDFMGVLMQVENFDWDAYQDDVVAEADWNALMKNMYSKAYGIGLMDNSGYTQDQFMNMIDNGYVNNAYWIDYLYNQTLQGLKDNVQMISDNPILAGFLQSIISDESVLQNLDFTSITGALDGIVEALDFKQAVDQAAENGNVNEFGQYLVQGLADGVESNAGLIEPPFSTVAANALAALQAAFGIASPSTLMMAQGIFIPEGLALGILNGTGISTAAMVSVSNATLAAARAILTHAAGHAIGYNVAAGVASGIRSGSGMAAAAARALANSVVSTLRSSLQIHSPSRVTYELGDNTGIGFVNGILDNRTAAEKAMGRVVGSAESVWNTAAWSDIALFAGLENEQLLQDAKDAVKISDADIRKIRELAEREVINMFTTAEVKVEMNNRNEIKSNMDLDGIVDYLGEKVTERLEAVAEGVYA